MASVPYNKKDAVCTQSVQNPLTEHKINLHGNDHVGPVACNPSLAYHESMKGGHRVGGPTVRALAQVHTNQHAREVDRGRHPFCGRVNNHFFLRLTRAQVNSS